MNVTIVCNDPNLYDDAKKISIEFGLPINELNAEIVTPNYIKITQDHICLYQTHSDLKNNLKLEIDFSSSAYNRKFSSPKKELLGKALGWNQGYRKVLDLTAGLGIDTVFISQMGFSVTAVERNPALALLLSQALSKSTQFDIPFVFSEAKKYLENLDESHFPEVIYYDPMYPSTRKTALPNKNMQVLRQMIGEDEANSDLLRLAISKCSQRVVVKRPLSAPCVLEKPSMQMEGKLVRYDIYKAK